MDWQVSDVLLSILTGKCLSYFVWMHVLQEFNDQINLEEWLFVM